ARSGRFVPRRRWGRGDELRGRVMAVEQGLKTGDGRPAREDAAGSPDDSPHPARSSFALTEDQQLFRRTVREFAAREIAPVAAEFDETEQFPAENVRKMADLGLMGLTAPEAYGGSGAGAMEYALAMEEIARADAAHSTILTVNVSLVTEPLAKLGTEQQRRAFLPALCDGRMVGAYCLSEPSSGSDAANMDTRATREGDEWVINGTKN